MNIANTDYIQATIEIFGFIITVVFALIFWIITGNKEKSSKYLMTALLLSGLSLLVDAGWYIYDGDRSQTGYVINWLCNLLIFICNPCMLFCINRYLTANIEENGGSTVRLLNGIVDLFAFLAFTIPISNLFYKWMYCIDSQNVYCRLFGWYVYTLLNSIAIIACLIIVIRQRSILPKWRRIAFYTFLGAPFAGIALQSLVFGISFIQIGIAIGSVGIVACYLVEWIRYEKSSNDISEDKKRLWLIECVFAVMILFVSAAIISCVVSVNKVSAKSSEQSSMTLAFMVSETIDGALAEPVNVSRTMAQSCEVIEALSADSLEETEEEARMLAFMKRIKDEYDYQMIFVASENTKAYYTYDGLSRYMQVDADSRDAWYNEFKAGKIRYELNIDADKDNDMELAVFVNMEVRDNEGKLIGVCGVATSIESMMGILKKYEDEYDLNIFLTDMEGIIQVSTDRNKIEQEKLPVIVPDKNSETVSYEKSAAKARLTKYMQGLDWYLVIEDNNPNKMNIFEMVFPSMIIYVLGVILMVSFSIVFAVHEKKRSSQLEKSKKLSETDGLTGLRNRYSLDVFCEMLNKNGMPEELSVMMIDINGLKAINDSLGHDAGDEAIIATAKCLQTVFAENSTIYRNGGDEFVIAGSYGEGRSAELKNRLEEEIKRWKGKCGNELALSIGIASHRRNPELSFFNLLKLADNEMYKSKAAYYSQTGKDRRGQRI